MREKPIRLSSIILREAWLLTHGFLRNAGQFLTPFLKIKMASKPEYELPDYEYDLDENEEDKQNSGDNKVTKYIGVHSAGFKDLLLKP